MTNARSRKKKKKRKLKKRAEIVSTPPQSSETFIYNCTGCGSTGPWVERALHKCPVEPDADSLPTLIPCAQPLENSDE